MSLLGDLEEERRAPLARGTRRISAASAWYTAEILRACVWGLRDAARRPAACARDAAAMSMFSWPDIKLSLRLLVRNPGLTAVSTVGIAVGIAIGAGMFGFVHANSISTLPLDEGDRIVALENWDVAGNNENRQSLHDFVTWRGSDDVRRRDQRISRSQRDDAGGRFVPETVRIAAMSASGFRVARVPALVGRLLTPEDEREAAPPVVVIGYTGLAIAIRAGPIGDRAAGPSRQHATSPSSA